MMKYISIDKVKEIIDFNKGSYFILGISRKKDNDDITHAKEMVYRRLVTNELSLERAHKEITGLIELDDKHNYKLYVNYNARNVKKAYKNLKEKMANWDYEISNDPNIMTKIVNVDKEWISCLARNPCKKDYFMLDLDEKDKLPEVLESMSPMMMFQKAIETQNGYHILFKPCDTRDFEERIKVKGIDCEVKKDDLLCIGYPEVNK